MKRESLASFLIIPVVFLGFVLLVGMVPPRSLARIVQDYLLRSQYYAGGYLQSGEMLPSSPRNRPADIAKEA